MKYLKYFESLEPSQILDEIKDIFTDLEDNFDVESSYHIENGNRRFLLNNSITPEKTKRYNYYEALFLFNYPQDKEDLQIKLLSDIKSYIQDIKDRLEIEGIYFVEDIIDSIDNSKIGKSSNNNSCTAIYDGRMVYLLRLYLYKEK